MTFLELAKRVLEEEEKALSVDEIWQVAKAKGYDKLLASKGKTPWATLGAQLYVNVRDHKDSPFVQIGTRPKRFYLRNLSGTIELQTLDQQEVSEVPEKSKYLESDLHPFLAYYAYYYLKAYTKTIQHTKSGKKEFGEWIHPDMVGCYFPIEDWKPEVFEFGKSVAEVAVRLFSFEIKRELDFSNLREAFFQAVSNSSWAHEGYLVASEIASDEEFTTELGRLSASFGIGVIKINIEDPDSSEIMFSARRKEDLDWEAINKLAINPDFTDFLRRVNTDISSKEIRKEKYDKIRERDELIKMIKR